MKQFFTLLLLIGLSTSLFAQDRTCASHDHFEEMKNTNPAFAARYAEIEAHTNRIIEEQAKGGNSAERVSGVITIPVVVHVLYRTTQENISNAQIQSQIAVLNEDFRRLNADRTKVPSLFAPLAADIEIQFVLATTAPNGSSTTGITRKSTTRTSWGTNNAMKFSSQGGTDAWDTSKYLNIWVCNIGNNILGYAQFPGGAAATDGVVISPNYFGSSDKGTGFYLSAPFDKGRTATHEVGHWLNLRHIWGDANCGNDFVADTPTQQTSNGGCPAFPKPSCGNTSDMWMNYMDYTNDACMYMFTAGQKDRMRALFAAGGARASFAGGATTPAPTPTPTYCASRGNNNNFEWIDLVNLGSINRTSAREANGYTNTGLSTTLRRGTSYTITYSAGFSSTAYTEYWKVYIDWNGDGDFLDAGETVVNRTSSSSANLTTTFTVPTSAVVGTVRMRVSMSDSNQGSCSTFNYGEVEDYNISIIAARESGEEIANTLNALEKLNVELYPNPAGSFTTLKVRTQAESATVQMYDVRGSLVYSTELKGQGEHAHEINLSGFKAGMYFINVLSGEGIAEKKKLVITQ
jgi:hypothetical protein